MEPVPLNNFPPPLASLMNHHDARMMHLAIQPVPVVWPSCDRLFSPAYHIDHHLHDGAQRIWLMRPALQPIPAVFKFALGATHAVCSGNSARSDASLRRPPASPPVGRCAGRFRGLAAGAMRRRRTRSACSAHLDDAVPTRGLRAVRIWMMQCPHAVCDADSACSAHLDDAVPPCGLRAVRIWMTRRIGMYCALFSQRARARLGPAGPCPGACGQGDACEDLGNV